MSSEPRRDTKAAVDTLDALFKDMENEEKRAMKAKKAVRAEPVVVHVKPTPVPTPVPVAVPTPKPTPAPPLVRVRVSECDLCGAVIRPEDPFGVFPAPRFGSVDCVTCIACFIANAPLGVRG